MTPSVFSQNTEGVICFLKIKKSGDVQSLKKFLHLPQ